MPRTRLAFLCPSLNKSFKLPICADHAHAYSKFRKRYSHNDFKRQPSTETTVNKSSGSHTARLRLQELQAIQDVAKYYPRLDQHGRPSRQNPGSQGPPVTADGTQDYLGRVQAVRRAGSKLFFLDLMRDGKLIQVMCNARHFPEDSLGTFKDIAKLARRGDWYHVLGRVTINDNGKEVIQSVELPTCIAPTLREVPRVFEDEQKLARYPHVRQITHAAARDMIRLRHVITSAVRQYLEKDSFLEVSTPILESNAGGATARPFETSSHGLTDNSLKLRIAPELSLKRLVVGGMDKIYEIGKVFRNEGIDATHNPEFTMCEFYEVGAALDDLKTRTQNLLSYVYDRVNKAQDVFEQDNCDRFDGVPAHIGSIDFIPTLQDVIKRPLPDLTSPSALEELIGLFEELGLALPVHVTLPDLLETLSERYLEPLSKGFTWIQHHPECLVPLAKSYIDPNTKQRVAASAELFIKGKEMVNCYEEENSPFEQRRKFEQQIRLRTSEDGTKSDEVPEVDESYLEVLEWGMPPTGGWGCGIDRLVMLFSGAERISDVLVFGSLRNSVAMSRHGRSTQSLIDATEAAEASEITYGQCHQTDFNDK